MTSAQSLDISTTAKTWRLSAFIDKAGRHYIYAYWNQWDPVKKQSRNGATRSVGRILEDGRVRFSPKFLADHPEYAEGVWVYQGNQLISTSEKDLKKDMAEQGYAYRCDALHVGVTYGLWVMACQRGIYQDLQSVFGKEDAAVLLALGIYLLDSPGAMMNFEYWLSMVYIPYAQPVDGRRISEVLARVTKTKVAEYFKLRHRKSAAAAKKLREQRRKDDPKAYIPPQTLAFDSTSIGTYSETISDAAYGHAKQDKDLKQVNLTLVCDYDTAEVIYAYTSEGSINDKAVFSDILTAMFEAEFDLNDTMIVTDRGYFSPHNIQAQINKNVKFIQGIPLIEDSIKRNFDRHWAHLNNPACYHAKIELACVPTRETWVENLDCGKVSINVQVFLYYDALLGAMQRKAFLDELDQVLTCLQQGKKPEANAFRKFKPFLRQQEHGWIADATAVQNRLRYCGCFAIRSNEVTDPEKAMLFYRQRNVVEKCFNQFKNETAGNRMRCQQSAHEGKLFAHTLAQTLRMMLSMNAAKGVEKNPALQLPKNSLTAALALLRAIQGIRPPKRNLWVTGPIAKKQREILTLLDLPSPPKFLTH